MITRLLFFCITTWLIAGCRYPLAAERIEADPARAFSPSIISPTLADFWEGRAHFQLEINDTGLPMGESDTHTLPGSLHSNPQIWSYVHASYPSLGVIDQCGDPVEFPGCIVIFESTDNGRSFTPRPHAPAHRSLPAQEEGKPAPGAICQIPCRSCPCDSARDQIDQQQYPRVKRYRMADAATGGTRDVTLADTWLMVYEYRANVFLRRSTNGLDWSNPEEIPLTGIWRNWLARCPQNAQIGAHPHTPQSYDCLVGSPPGLFIDNGPAEVSTDAPQVYVFVGLGQNPGAMGCFRGALHSPATLYRLCDQNPLFTGAPVYGPTDDSGPATNPYFDFRTISSAQVIQLDREYYMLFEGVRGPEAGAAGDTQFALGLARTTAARIDGPWQTYAGNPVLLDMPGNVGVGHADLLMLDGVTYLYTSVDGNARSRFILVWHD